ncbi:MAG: hypothetical protein HLUCCA12_00125 [Rhodobacteraceae bacterium HLUCCA12]|nr:MAG: hypothetical protein HLUCCA12_00125 [Rhodobacteraceae bacterium HLUCCA12]
MTNDNPRQGEAGAPDIVAVAEWHLGETSRALRVAITDIEAGRFGTVKELGSTISALRKALEAVFSERAKLERIGTANGGDATAMDLGAARAEIRRRMDRLRASGNPGEVPGKPE